MHKLRSAIAGILALFIATAAIAQTFPTVPPNTVIGRLGGNTTGPSQAIPFATLQAQLGIVGKPFVILATGQSNFVLQPAFSWTPAANAKIWNNTPNLADVGTAYTALSSTTVNITSKLASDIATAMPSRQVCLIRVAFSNKEISHWLTGTGAPDVYQNILDQIPAALTACGGASKIDMFAWWQGEANATPVLNTNYLADFFTMMNRFWSNAWFPRETPILVHGIASNDIAGSIGYNQMNEYLSGVVNADPDKRRFVYTASLGSATYWDATNPAHMTAQGYFSAGAMASSAFLNGPGRNSVPSIISSPSSGNLCFGPNNGCAPSDPFTFNFNGLATLPLSTGSLLTVIGANGTDAVSRFEAYAGMATLSGYRSNGTYTSRTALGADNIITRLEAKGYDGLVDSGPQATFDLISAGAWSTPSHGTYAALSLTPAASTTRAISYLFNHGSFRVFGTGSGGPTIASQAAGGTGTLTLPTGTGTFAVNASAPLAINATTGNTTCATCVTSSGGGAITGTAPISVSAAGAVSVTGAALTKTDDTNVTVTLGGTPASALLAASSITMGWTGQLSPTRGGTGSNLSATGGTSQVLKQTSTGGNITVGQLSYADISGTHNTNTNLSFVADASASLVANSTFYLGSGRIAGTEGVAALPLSVPGTIKNLYCSTLSGPGGATTYIATLRKNTSSQTLTCTMTGATATCNDTTHSFSANAGDLLALQLVTLTGAATANGFNCSTTLVTTSP